MLYNGIDLPAIESAYEYAYIVQNIPLEGDINQDEVFYNLILTDVPLYKSEGDGYESLAAGEAKLYKMNGVPATGWDLLATTDLVVGSQYLQNNKAVWASEDLYGVNGSLVLEGSEPQESGGHYVVRASALAAIGAAIRKKLGVNTLYKPGEMPEAIEGIQGEAEQPTVTSIDYSTWDSGAFSETLDNGAKLTYTVENDTEGRPIKVTRPDGSEVSVAW